MSNEIASYKAIVRAVIKKITSNYNEDLEQEAYLKIWQNKENYQEQGKKIRMARYVDCKYLSRLFKISF